MPDRFPRVAPVITRIGDALAGVDRQSAFLEGQEARANVDLRRAQAEAAMQQARERQEAAAIERLRREARSRLVGLDNAVLADPNTAPIADLILGELGQDFSQTMTGRGTAREYQIRDVVADPTAGDDARLAALEALAPTTAVNRRLTALLGLDTRSEPMEIVDENGQGILVPRSEAAGRPAGARPSTARSTAQGGIRAADSSAIYRQAAGLFGGTYDPVSGRILGLDRSTSENVQRIASRASQLFLEGGIDHATAVDVALQELRQGLLQPPEPMLQPNRPPLDSFDPAGRPPLDSFFQ